MTSLPDLLQQGSQNAWLFIPSAILLGALHGLEPGHSKTMMAAFIVAVRGTVKQAVLLGLAATLSHTAVVWIVALAGIELGGSFRAEDVEPYLQLVSAALIIGIALWMLGRTWREHRRESIWRQRNHAHGHADDADPAGHGHEPFQEKLDAAGAEYQDAHEAAHADDIRRRFDGRRVTTGQIVVFGLTGGLIPCPAAITVLLLCLQLKRFTLGISLVLCFSIGLAVTMVLSGTLAALSVRHVGRRFSGFGAFARRAPYVSGILIVGIGIMVGWQGYSALPA